MNPVGAASAPDLDAWRARSEALLDRLLAPANATPQRLHAAQRHAVLGGGKRMRPLLVYATGHALGAPLESLDHAAAAVELIHAYSLVHDDLPAMDDDALRRGRPTVHVAFDEACAILAGDSLQALAFEVLTQAPLAPAQVVAMTATLARASGAAGMAGGQAIDLEAVGRGLDEAALADMHRRKTGALIAASVRLGALAADADAITLDHLNDFAEALGLAFQIRDDLLDVEASSAELGKTAGKDAASNKPTYVSVLGIEGARQRMETLQATMRRALQVLNFDAPALAALAALAVGRGS